MLNPGRVKNAILPILPIVFVLCASAIESKANTVGICSPDSPAQYAPRVNTTGNAITITGNTFTTTNVNFSLFGPSAAGRTGSVSPDGSRTRLISATNNDYSPGVVVQQKPELIGIGTSLQKRLAK